MTRVEAKPVAPVLESAYQFLLWLLPTVEKLPRSYKFSLGDRIAATALNLLDRLIEAATAASGAPAVRPGPAMMKRRRAGRLVVRMPPALGSLRAGGRHSRLGVAA